MLQKNVRPAQTAQNQTDAGHPAIAKGLEWPDTNKKPFHPYRDERACFPWYHSISWRANSLRSRLFHALILPVTGRPALSYSLLLSQRELRGQLGVGRYRLAPSGGSLHRLPLTLPLHRLFSYTFLWHPATLP
jgi:hypothetical protein